MAAPDRPGIETLVARLREEQATANESLARFVREDHLVPLCEQLTELVAAARPLPVNGAIPVEAAEMKAQEPAGNGAERAAGERV